MNLSPRWSASLTAAGVEAVHWSIVGFANAADREIMAFAQANDYIVLTQDLDFGIMLATSGESRPSVVQLRTDDVSPEVVGALVTGALHQVAADLGDGVLLTIDPKRTRLRLLPLRPSKPITEKE